MEFSGDQNETAPDEGATERPESTGWENVMETTVETPSGLTRVSREIIKRYLAGEFSIDDVLRIVDKARPDPATTEKHDGVHDS